MTLAIVLLLLLLILIIEQSVADTGVKVDNRYKVSIDNLDVNGFFNYNDGVISITIDSTTVPFDPRGGNIKIISSNDIGKVLTDSTVFDYNFGEFTFNWITTNFKSTSQLNFHWDVLYESLFGSPQGPSIETNLRVVDWNTAVPPFYVVLVNDEGNKILAISKPFKVGRKEVKVTWANNTGVYPGEYVPIASQEGGSRSSDYWKIFKVNSTSLKKTPLAFNSNTSAKLVRINGYFAFVGWWEPGLYQVVFISEYGQVIIGISDPFKVLRRTRKTKAIVQTNKQSYNAGEDIIFTVQQEVGTRGWNNMILLFYPVNATVYNGSNTGVIETGFSTFMQNNPSLIEASTEWAGNTTTYEFPIKLSNLPTLGGLSAFAAFPTARYKVGIYIQQDDLFLLGVTKPIRISNDIAVKLPKRWLAKGEAVPFQVINPYYNFTFGNSAEYRFETHIVYADPSKRMNRNGLVVSEPYLNINIGTGLYKFAFYTVTNNKARYAFDITNSSFRVVDNIATITTDRREYSKGDVVYFTITTERNVPIRGPFSIVTNSVSPSQIYKIIFTGRSDNELINKPTLTGSYTIDWDDTGMFQIELRTDFDFDPTINNVWARSEKFSIV